ncbi:MAG: DUF975 family protein, partial [Anaerovoracaceae bacterium]
MEQNNHVIISTSSSKLKEYARSYLKGAWIFVTLICAVYSFLGDTYTMTSVTSNVLTSVLPDITKSIKGIEIILITTCFVMQLILGGAISFGVTSYILKRSRGENPSKKEVFSGFKNYKGATALFCLALIRVFAWSLLFSIPGLMAYYRYAMAFYIMVDNPGKKASEYIEDSKRIMMDNKASLLSLDITFFGWFVAPLAPIFMLFVLDITNPFVFAFCLLFLIVVVMLVEAYSVAANTAFYRTLKAEIPNHKKEEVIEIIDGRFEEKEHIDNNTVKLKEKEETIWTRKQFKRNRMAYLLVLIIIVIIAAMTVYAKADKKIIYTEAIKGQELNQSGYFSSAEYPIDVFGKNMVYQGDLRVLFDDGKKLYKSINDYSDGMRLISKDYF